MGTEHPLEIDIADGGRKLDAKLAMRDRGISLFWAAYAQQGNTIVLRAEDFTDRVIDLSNNAISRSRSRARYPLLPFGFRACRQNRRRRRRSAMR
jgi:hypothetical protein